MASRHWLRPTWFAIVLAIVAVALFVRLGAWQYGRMQGKQAAQSALARVLAGRNPLPLAQTASDPARAHDYDWAAGTGAFADREPILLDEQVRNGRFGVRVYRVFYMEMAERSPGGNLLVDLGWLPLRADRKLPDADLGLQNRVELRGLLAPPPASGIALGPGIEHREHAWLATRIDPPAIAPVVLEWTPGFTPLLAPRDVAEAFWRG